MFIFEEVDEARKPRNNPHNPQKQKRNFNRNYLSPGSKNIHHHNHHNNSHHHNFNNHGQNSHHSSNMSLNNALATAALQSLVNNAPPAPGNQGNNNIPGFENLATALLQSNQPISPAPHVNPAHAFSSGAQSPNNSVHSSNNMYGFQENMVFGNQGGNNNFGGNNNYGGNNFNNNFQGNNFQGNGNNWNQRGGNRQNSGKRSSDNRLKSNDNQPFGRVGIQNLGNTMTQNMLPIFNNQSSSKVPPPVNYNGNRNFQRTSDSTHSDATDHGNLRSPNKGNKNIAPIGTQNATNAFDANSAAALLQQVLRKKSE